MKNPFSVFTNSIYLKALFWRKISLKTFDYLLKNQSIKAAAEVKALTKFFFFLTNVRVIL